MTQSDSLQSISQQTVQLGQEGNTDMDAHIHPARDDLFASASTTSADTANSPKPEAESETDSVSTATASTDHAEAEEHPEDDTEDDTASTDQTDDPRATLALEVSKHRPRARSPPQGLADSFHRSGAPSPSTRQASTHDESQSQRVDQGADQSQGTDQKEQELETILRNLNLQNKALEARRDEEAHIQALYTKRCQTLESEVRGLRDEVRVLYVLSSFPPFLLSYLYTRHTRIGILRG